MSFLIDQQTLDELNLLGKFRPDSVYHLFNRSRTRGGERLLDRLFRQPMTDADAINERSALLAWFGKKQLAFSFDPQQVALMQEYLDAGRAGNRWILFLDTAIKKGLSILARDERYKNLIQRIHAVIDLLVKCRQLTEQLGEVPAFYQERIDSI